MQRTAPPDAAAMDHEAALAALLWQMELGADEPVGEAPVDRYDLPDATPKPSGAPVAGLAASEAAAPPESAASVAAVATDPIAEAGAMAAAAGSLAALAGAQEAYPYCNLKRGARNFVFADGDARARVMVIGEAPGREEDQEGRPFVGAAGQLLDKMFAAIGLSRTATDPEAALYITNVLPWRPPQNREPEPAEIAMMLPFLARHVELAGPEIVVLMGNTPCAAALGRRGILRLRGTWTRAFGRSALPMTHPAYLLRTSEAKREAWADLLAIRARLDGKAP